MMNGTGSRSPLGVGLYTQTRFSPNYAPGGATMRTRPRGAVAPQHYAPPMMRDEETGQQQIGLNPMVQQIIMQRMGGGGASAAAPEAASVAVPEAASVAVPEAASAAPSALPGAAPGAGGAGGGAQSGGMGSLASNPWTAAVAAAVAAGTTLGAKAQRDGSSKDEAYGTLAGPLYNLPRNIVKGDFDAAANDGATGPIGLGYNVFSGKDPAKSFINSLGPAGQFASLIFKGKTPYADGDSQDYINAMVGRGV